MGLFKELHADCQAFLQERTQLAAVKRTELKTSKGQNSWTKNGVLHPVVQAAMHRMRIGSTHIPLYKIAMLVRGLCDCAIVHIVV